jgi:hypothetical protein
MRKSGCQLVSTLTASGAGGFAMAVALAAGGRTRRNVMASGAPFNDGRSYFQRLSAADEIGAYGAVEG